MKKYILFHIKIKMSLVARVVISNITNIHHWIKKTKAKYSYENNMSKIIANFSLKSISLWGVRTSKIILTIKMGSKQQEGHSSRGINRLAVSAIYYSSAHETETMKHGLFVWCFENTKIVHRFDSIRPTDLIFMTRAKRLFIVRFKFIRFCETVNRRWKIASFPIYLWTK